MNKKWLVGIVGLAMAAFTAVGVANADNDTTPAGSACLVGTVDCVDADLGGDAEGAAGSACLVGTVDCVDADLGGDSGEQRLDAETMDLLAQKAQGLLGMNEADLPTDVRIARRGAEWLALTEDHLIGRITVELDDTDGSGYRVVTASVEVPNGTAQWELTAG